MSLHKPRVLRGALTLVALALVATACDGDAEIVPRDDPDDVAANDQPAVGVADLPDWLDRIYPEPGAETTATQAVQVIHNARGPEDGVRLYIDGVDVTTYSVQGRGQLVYDPDQEASPVRLEPGEHTAVVELVRLPEPGAQHELVDRFEWEFQVH